VNFTGFAPSSRRIHPICKVFISLAMGRNF